MRVTNGVSRPPRRGRPPRLRAAVAAGCVTLAALAGCGDGPKPSGSADHQKPRAATSAVSVEVPANGTTDLAGPLTAGESGNSQAPVQLGALSCAGDGFCMVLAGWTYVELSGGKATFGSLASKSLMDAQPGGPSGWLSCASPTFCLAVSTVGAETYQLTWDGKTWGAVSLGQSADVPLSEASALTCPDEQGCFSIVDDGTHGPVVVGQYDHGTWSYDQVDPEGIALDISCASVQYCYLLTNSGQVVHRDSSGWGDAYSVTVADQQGAEDPVGAIWCAPGPYCLGVGELGGGVLEDAGTGFTPKPLAAIYSTGGDCFASGRCFVEPQSAAQQDPPALLDNGTLTSLPGSETLYRDMPFDCASDGLCVGVSGTSLVTYPVTQPPAGATDVPTAADPNEKPSCATSEVLQSTVATATNISNIQCSDVWAIATYDLDGNTVLGVWRYMDGDWVKQDTAAVCDSGELPGTLAVACQAG